VRDRCNSNPNAVVQIRVPSRGRRQLLRGEGGGAAGAAYAAVEGEASAIYQRLSCSRAAGEEWELRAKSGYSA
jgi:hypothetical protein